MPVFWWNLLLYLLKTLSEVSQCGKKWQKATCWMENGVQKELFLTQPIFLIMPKINLNLLRKLASLVTWVNSRWFLALKKNLASLKKSSFFYAASIQQILIFNSCSSQKRLEKQFFGAKYIFFINVARFARKLLGLRTLHLTYSKHVGTPCTSDFLDKKCHFGSVWRLLWW